MEKIEYMRRAIELARLGEGWTNPNPLVGAVIVRDGIIIGEGFHHRYGEQHAERDALKNCYERGNNPAGAEIYVTLEPCCHFGKQPPCTHALVEAGIGRVIVGSRDPNPLVHGKGNAYLRENGIEVEEDFLREECDALNEIFFHYITTKMPYVALKYAMTMDGKIATCTGESKWITGEKSREYVHVLRNKYAAIMCGIGTVLADDPMLNCRFSEAEKKSDCKSSFELYGASNPLRIVCDSKLRIPENCRLVQTAKEIPVIVACCAEYVKGENMMGKIQRLEKLGVEVVMMPCNADGHADVSVLFEELGKRKIDSVLVEGGADLNYGVLESGNVKKIFAFIAPKIFGGGAGAKSPVGGTGIEHPSDCFAFEIEKMQKIGDDVLIEYKRKVYGK